MHVFPDSNAKYLYVSIGSSLTRSYYVVVLTLQTTYPTKITLKTNEKLKNVNYSTVVNTQ